MKKYLLVVLAVLALFLTGCGKKTYTSLNYVEYLEKLDNKETFPLVIGSDTCSACKLFKGTMESFITEYQVEVYYIDISKLSEDEYNALKSQTSFDGTPTTVFIKDGALTSYYNRIDGAESYSKVVETYKNNNYID